MKRNHLVLSTALLALVAFALPVLAQATKEKSVEKKPPSGAVAQEKSAAGTVKVTISAVVKEDANAKKVAEGRLIPVRFQWLCGSEGNAKLLTLEAKLITLNTDGKSTTVTKKIVD